LLKSHIEVHAKHKPAKLAAARSQEQWQHIKKEFNLIPGYTYWILWAAL